MTTTPTRRTQAERDAMTVEIGFALFTATLLAGGAFALIALPVLAGTMSDTASRALLVAAGSTAAVLFVARTAQVLWQFGRRGSSD
ncbi:DUF6332 family protein [Streptomyces longispororuber]|uniref:DUF6332 family protein n=1 Tax=Streptomyces longispororuber TaxID=68230 RepID=UPI00210C5707|nr:DUF6332 family protein [Streptomyces longispororuber]MCQ4206000.1 DUF6332 family protein [Streptomyces longispororuber]